MIPATHVFKVKPHGDGVRLIAMMRFTSEADLHCYPGLDDNKQPNVSIQWKGQMFTAPDFIGAVDVMIESQGDEWLTNLLQQKS